MRFPSRPAGGRARARAHRRHDGSAAWPGVRVTHAAIKAICDNGCTVIWCGEFGSRFYAVGMGETRSAANLLLQAKLCMDETAHIGGRAAHVCAALSRPGLFGLTLRQIRGLEGIRVREAYRQFAGQYGVPWKKTQPTSRRTGTKPTPSNRALSVAMRYFTAFVRLLVVSLGFSPGLGFIHTGKMLSFVYDIADLYKLEASVPAAFSVIGGSYADLEREVRAACRRWIRTARVLKRIPEDIAWILMPPPWAIRKCARGRRLVGQRRRTASGRTQLCGGSRRMTVLVWKTSLPPCAANARAGCWKSKQACFGNDQRRRPRALMGDGKVARRRGQLHDRLRRQQRAGLLHGSPRRPRAEPS